MASNSKSTTLTSTLGNKATLTAAFVENSTDITTNTSNITATAYIKMTAGTFSGSNSTYLKIYWHNNLTNSTDLLATLQVTALTSSGTSVSGSVNVQHASDGTASGYAYAEWLNGGTVGYVPRPGNVATDNTVLTTIPRASSIVAVDANIESATTISINKADPSFTTSISYSFAGTTQTPLTGTIVTKTSASSYGWTIPSSFYAKIPNSKTGICTLTATTYSGDTSIGTSTTTFTVTASETTSAPTGTLAVVDSNSTTTALTGDSNKIVRGYSNASCTITKSAQNSSSITSVKINDIEIGTSASTYTINNANTNVFNLVITDSRGYTKAVTVTKTLVDYIPLTVKATFARNTATDGKVNLQYNGNYFNTTFGTTSNTLTVDYRYRQSGGSWSSWITLSPTKSGNTYSQERQLSETFIYTNAFDFELRARDKLSTVVTSSAITKGTPVYWWDDSSFNVEVDAYVKGSAIPTIDLIYPVGSIYLTVNNVNPTNLFGGTWEQIRDKFLLSAGTNYPAGSIGGNATHTHNLGNAYAMISYDWINNENRLMFQGRVQSFSASRYTNTTAPAFVDGALTCPTATNLGGTTDASSNLPPYISVYVWKRIS